jgi:hypothetical protein
VSGDVLKSSQPAVIVLFDPMLMHLLQYILFLSLSYVNHVYLNWPKGTETFLVPAGFVWYAIIDLNRLIRLCGCNCVRFIFWPRIFLLTSWKIIFSVDFFQILPFWEAFCCHLTVFVIIETRVWKTQRVSDDYTTGLLFRPITFVGWNKN